MRFRILLSLLLLTPGLAIAEDKPALTEQRVKDLMEEKFTWDWNCASFDTVAFNIKTMTGIPVNVSWNLIVAEKEGKCETVSIRGEMKLEDLLEVIAGLCGFTVWREGTTLIFETIEEGDARIVVRFIDVREYLPSTRPPNEVAAMKPAERREYDEKQLLESRALGNWLQQVLIKDGLYVEGTSKVLIQTGRLEIRGNRKMMKGVPRLVEILGHSLENPKK